METKTNTDVSQAIATSPKPKKVHWTAKKEGLSWTGLALQKDNETPLMSNAQLVAVFRQHK